MLLITILVVLVKSGPIEVLGRLTQVMGIWWWCSGIWISRGNSSNICLTSILGLPGRMFDILFFTTMSKVISSDLKQNFVFSVRIPVGYQLILNAVCLCLQPALPQLNSKTRLPPVTCYHPLVHTIIHRQLVAFYSPKLALPPLPSIQGQPTIDRTLTVQFWAL